MQKITLFIDVVGSCNLKCPSCPMGNSRSIKPATGFMSCELLSDILDKAKRESIVQEVGLYNWTEAFLHPKLPELIEVVNSKGLSCGLSSNLNLMRNIDGVIKANPAKLRISMSGFTKEVYSYTHAGGDIEKVKANMVALAEAKNKYKATTIIKVLYHRYKHNLKEEAQVAEFAAKLGIGLEAVWAFFMPLEKVLALADDDPKAILTQEDKKLIDCLALPPKEALLEAQKHQAPCSLQTDQMVIDCTGNVQLCCGVFDPTKHTLGKYLDLSFDTLQQKKFKHPTCDTCMKHGAHLYATYALPEFNKIALSHISPEDRERLSYDIKGKTIKEKLVKIHRNYLSKLIPMSVAAKLGDCFDKVQYKLKKLL